ncbi:SDR family oxidoreductase [Streptomyces sp. NBC_00726]|uniref:SDR family NAD(P)-dependent oxidoreductase n=1 Tax=Streptomyces sp. NBC_00726 TaxID=2903674 RepID=UPI0038657853
MTDLANKTYFITGGGSGIGFATARRLLDEDANVVIAGRDAARLEKAVKKLDGGDRALSVTVDVSRPAELESAYDQVRARFGVLHGVFANAGIGLNARTADVTEEDFDQIVGTNFKGAFFTVQKALPLLAEGSSVVLNSSWLVHRGMGAGSVYAASKAAVLNLPQTLAPDLAGLGIRVNAVTPGHIHTEMFDAIAPVEEVREFFRGQVALGSLGTPQDIAETVLFLLSPRAAYITGQEFVVDGGLVGSVPA